MCSVDDIKYCADKYEEEFIEKWMKLSSIVGRAEEKEQMDKMCCELAKLFGKEGYSCRTISSGEGKPDVFVADRGVDGKPVLFAGHYDTVFSKTDWTEPIYITEDGKLKGPGVLDMKGGIVVALLVSRILEKIGRGDIPLKAVFVGDEEIGHEGSKSAEIISDESKKVSWALNLETGFENSDVCIGRKGTTTCEMRVYGTSSHPGNAFEKGKNAILEMADKIIKMCGFTEEENGLTVSPGKIRGGTAANVIPDFCECDFDLRFKTLKDYDILKSKIENLAKEKSIEGTETEINFKEFIPPFETTREIIELFEVLKKTANDIGQGEIRGLFRGGASDAAYISQAGIPVICSAGVGGADSHSVKEWAEVESLKKRAVLFTATILRMYDMKERS